MPLRLILSFFFLFNLKRLITLSITKEHSKSEYSKDLKGNASPEKSYRKTLAVDRNKIHLESLKK